MTRVPKTYQNFNHRRVAPLINIEKNKYILELFYGPTFAFKDYALQFLGNLFSHLIKDSDNNGNTGLNYLLKSLSFLVKIKKAGTNLIRGL